MRSRVLNVGVLVAVLAAGPAAERAAAQAPGNGEPGAANPPASGEAADPVGDRIEALEQLIKVLERKLEIEREQEKERAGNAPVLVAGREGFQIRSADGEFGVRFRGYLHTDGRFFVDDGDHRGTDTFVMRRVRPIFEATLFRFADFRVMPDFGDGRTTLQDAYLDLRFHRRFNVRAGKFKAPVGLERLASATTLLFVERALPTALVPNRDLGVLAFGDFAGARVTYAAGVFNGVTDGSSADADEGDGKDVVGRVFFYPFRASKGSRLEQLGAGVAVSHGTRDGTAATPSLPAFRTSGQQTWFRYRSDATTAGTAIADGRHQRVSTQGSYYTGPLALIAEHVLSRQAVALAGTRTTLSNQAWQVAGGWVLTGEANGERGVSPRRAFQPGRGGWGAFEVTARVTRLSVDDEAFPVFANPDAAASSATAWAGGLNWYLNRAVKLTANYEETRFRGGASSGDRPVERNLLTRFQVGF